MTTETTTKTKARTNTGSGMKVSDSFAHQFTGAAYALNKAFSRAYEEKCKITFDMWRVLSAAVAMDAKTPGAVSEAVCIDKVRISRAMSSLMERGMIRIAPAPSDGRVRNITVLAKGMAAYQAAAALTMQMEADIQKAMGAAGFGDIRVALPALLAALNEAPDPSSVS